MYKRNEEGVDLIIINNFSFGEGFSSGPSLKKKYRKENQLMQINDLVISTKETVGDEFVLVSIKPAYEYVDGYLLPKSAKFSPKSLLFQCLTSILSTYKAQALR